MALDSRCRTEATVLHGRVFKNDLCEGTKMRSLIMLSALVISAVSACKTKVDQGESADSSLDAAGKNGGKIYAQAYYGIEKIPHAALSCRQVVAHGLPGQSAPERFTNWLHEIARGVKYMGGGDQVAVAIDPEKKVAGGKTQVMFVGNFSNAMERVEVDYVCLLTPKQFKLLKPVPPSHSCLTAANITKCYNGSINGYNNAEGQTIPTDLISRRRVERRNNIGRADAEERKRELAQAKAKKAYEDKINADCRRAGGQWFQRDMGYVCRVETSPKKDCFIDYGVVFDGMADPEALDAAKRVTLLPVDLDGEGKPLEVCAK
jgi:hypothetical protein